jgi:hypothetical protein
MRVIPAKLVLAEAGSGNPLQIKDWIPAFAGMIIKGISSRTYKIAQL